MFNHSLSLGQWLSVGLVFLGISIEGFAKRFESREKKGSEKVIETIKNEGEKKKTKKKESTPLKQQPPSTSGKTPKTPRSRRKVEKN